MAGTEDIQALSKFVLFFPHDFRLYEQEGKQWSDHVIESTNSSDNIIVFNVSVRSDRELTVGHLYFWLGLNWSILNKVENSIVHHYF